MQLAGKHVVARMVGSRDLSQHDFQFLVSGETESFGSNNLMGQWLKAIGGFSVEQTGAPFDFRIEPTEYSCVGVA